MASTIAELNNGPYHLLVLYDLSKMVHVIDFLPTLIERFIIRIRTCQNEMIYANYSEMEIKADSFLNYN